MLKLIDVAGEKKGARSRVKAYWNTFHCQNIIYTNDGKMHAPLCKNWFCTYYCGIRKAELINKYLPEMQTWSEPHFITLTAKSVPAKHLKAMIQAIKKAFGIIKARCNKRSQRGKAVPIKGLRSLECNYNPRRRTYNPHFHLIVPTNKLPTSSKVNGWHSGQQSLPPKKRSTKGK